MSNDALIKGYTASRAIKYLYTLCTIAKILKKPFKEASEDDLKGYVAWLEKSHYSDWSRLDFKLILRLYLRWLGRGDLVSWLKPKAPKNRKLPEEVMTEEDITNLAGAAYNSRDKAIVLSLYESGCRIGEFLPLRLKHVIFDKYGALIRVTGKTGDRRIRLVASTLPLQSWLNEHPNKNDPEAYLWCKRPTQYNPKCKTHYVSYDYVRMVFKRLAEKAGVTKNVNPHAFRHARATFLASQHAGKRSSGQHVQGSCYPG